MTDSEITTAMWSDYTSGMSIKEVAAKWDRAASSVYGRFYRLNLPMRKSANSAGAMYFDYCLGMELEEVAQKWSYNPNTVRKAFKDLGVPLRETPHLTCNCRVRNPHKIEGIPFGDANRQRTLRASEKRRRQAAVALKDARSPLHRSVLQVRIDNPNATLTEMAALHDPPMTKDAFAAVLRRATTGVAQ